MRTGCAKNRREFRAFFHSRFSNRTFSYLRYRYNLLRFSKQIDGVLRDLREPLLRGNHAMQISMRNSIFVVKNAIYNHKCESFLNNLLRRKFSTESELLRGIEIAIKNITKAQHRRCFNEWFERMDKCIKAKGVYFEKL